MDKNQGLGRITWLAPVAQQAVSNHWVRVGWAGLGSFMGIGLVSWLTFTRGVELLIAPFGASAVLLYAASDSPLAQPRNTVGGHLISATVGVACYQVLGINWWTVALAVALAISLMLLTGTLHPPGGATSIVAVLSGQGWGFILAPVGVGAMLLVLISVLVHKLQADRKYPCSWW